MPDETEIRALVTRVVAGLVPDDTVDPPPPVEGLPTIAIGADHGGYPMKERLGFRLKDS